ncbi:DUF1636 family protein [Thalassococcus sp. BH17M4-6]|uniref:DUF1636 family protein n=1 Tax=Thalassococcus sp. BH17M4-6 TaxID=3413148 RepID=UPI003BC12A96
MTQDDGIILRLCESCQPDRSAVAPLQVAIDAAGLDVPVRVVAQTCMNGCARPVSLAIQGRGRATCFFNGVDPVKDRDDIVATLRCYLQSPKGWIEDARPCGRLRLCLVGRVPALSDSD